MTLRIGTSEAGGTFHTQALAIAGLFNKGRPDGENRQYRTDHGSFSNDCSIRRCPVAGQKSPVFEKATILAPAREQAARSRLLRRVYTKIH